MNNSNVAKALAAYPTPFYVFDEGALRGTIDCLQQGLPANASLCYAMKANPFIVAQAARNVERVEVCSPGEMRICQLLGVPNDQVVVSGVHKDEALMRELVLDDKPICRFTVESVRQYHLLERVAQEAGKRIPVLLRLTSGNQFGLDPSDARELVARALTSEWLEFCGMQYFSGTQKTSPKKLQRELTRLDKFLGELATTHGDAVGGMELEFGPGLPAEYYEQDEAVARAKEDTQYEALCDALSAMSFAGSVILELGRAIAAPCGTYVTSIVDTKCNKGQNYAIVDGGMHQLVYYGHAMSLQQPVCSLYPPRDDDAPELWSIYGSLCTTNDALAKQISLCDVKVGDALVFPKTGAYSMTEGISLFLSRDLPRIVMVDFDGNMWETRGRIETYPFNCPNATITGVERVSLD